MSTDDHLTFVQADEVETRATLSIYPAPFAARMQGRHKRVLGALFGLQNFGVNHTTLEPGAQSALRHAHALQDEFIYILAGTATLIDDQGAHALPAGACAGFKAGSGNAHHLRNDTDQPVVYLEIGDRTAGDAVHYPDDDLVAESLDGRWQFRHKDGRPYE